MQVEIKTDVTSCAFPLPLAKQEMGSKGFKKKCCKKYKKKGKRCSRCPGRMHS